MNSTVSNSLFHYTHACSIRDVLLFPTMRPLPKNGQESEEDADEAEETTEA